MMAKVSIHAPTWGATRTRQHTQCGEAFQSTHPHGVRHQDDTTQAE